MKQWVFYQNCWAHLYSVQGTKDIKKQKREIEIIRPRVYILTFYYWILVGSRALLRNYWIMAYIVDLNEKKQLHLKITPAL